MATDSLEVEFQIVAIRCTECKLTQQVSTEPEANRFMIKHGLHGKLIYLARTTAPPEFVDGRLIELEFSKAATQ